MTWYAVVSDGTVMHDYDVERFSDLLSLDLDTFTLQNAGHIVQYHFKKEELWIDGKQFNLPLNAKFIYFTRHKKCIGTSDTDSSGQSTPVIGFECSGAKVLIGVNDKLSFVSK